MKFKGKPITLAMAMLCCAAIISGCSTVVVKRQVAYDQFKEENPCGDAGCKTKDGYVNVGKGFEAYRAQPYLLVKYTTNKDNPVDTQIVNLPDWDHRMVIKQRAGIGKSTLGLVYNGSMLVSVNSDQDSKTAEMLTAAGGAAGTALTGLTGLAGGVTGAISSATALAGEVKNLLSLFTQPGDRMLENAVDLRPQWVVNAYEQSKQNNDQLPRPLKAKLSVWAYLELASNSIVSDTKFEKVTKEIKQMQIDLELYNFIDRNQLMLYLAFLNGVKKSLEEMLPSLTETTQSNKAKTAIQNVVKASKEITQILALFNVPNQPFELYRIDQDGLHLTPVTTTVKAAE